MKVALYARVSKDEAASDGSLQDPENQIGPLRKLCEANGWVVRDDYIFVDKASGGSANRPEFQRMLSEVRQNHVDIVLIWALDRFSREGITSTLKYIKTLKDYRCGLKSLQESWLDTSQEGVSELLLAMMSWWAAEERKKISERTIAGLDKRKQDLKKYGYFLNKKGKKVYGFGRPKKKKGDDK